MFRIMFSACKVRLCRVVCLLAVLLSLSACNNVETEFVNSPCWVVIDNSIHQNPVLASSMNASAPGLFCIVRRTMQNGANCFRFDSADGNSSTSVFTAIDERRTLIFGFNNGLIVGFGSLSSPMTFYAYDLECPNCFDPNYIPVRSKPLSISVNGLATCNLCKRQYDMNNGGIVSKGEGGKKMTRYRAATTGPLGVMSVN